MKVELNSLLILSIIAVALTGCSPEPQRSATVAVNTQPQAKSKETPTPTPKKVEAFNAEEVVAIKKFITSVVNENAGEKTVLREDERIRIIEIKDKSVIVELLADPSLAIELVKLTVLDQSAKIFKAAFKDRKDISGLTLNWQYNEVDAKGNEKITPIISLTLSSENEKTFNWDKVVFTRLPEAVDTYKEYFKK